MVTRNLTIYTLDSNNNRTQLNPPYTISIGFGGGVIVVYVAVDNDFENDSYTVNTISDDILIKKVCNTVTISVNPNYDNITRDIIVNFEHNIDTDDTIPLLIRQTWQPYDIMVRPSIVDCCSTTEENFDPVECFSYVSKSGAMVERTSYRIRDNVFLNDDEDIVIENFNEIGVAITELTEFMYYNVNTNERIYVEEYVELSSEEMEDYKPLYYIFIDDEYNEYSTSYNEGYEPYRYSSEDGNSISVYEWLKLPEYSTEEELGQDYYYIAEYIKVYENNENIVDTPRYKYNTISYRNTITQSEYNALPYRSKSGCTPLTYINIYDNELEVINAEYDNMSRSERYKYAPNRYVVFNNDNKTACETVVTSDEYETYPIEGKYDYILENGVYYRELSVDDFENYPESGQIKYNIYQYVNKNDINDVIDFSKYKTLSNAVKEAYRIYRYCGDSFTKSTKMWVNVEDDEDIICNGVYETLTEEEQGAYRYYYENETLTFEEYAEKKTNEMWEHINWCKMLKELDDNDPVKENGYEEYSIDYEIYYKLKEEYRYISANNYNNLTNDQKTFYRLIIYTPDEVITPSKYESLPSYGKDSYTPYKLRYVEELLGLSTYEEYEITEDDYTDITFDEYLSIPLARGDYVVNEVTVVDDRISCEQYEQLSSDEKKSYELCYRLSRVVNQKMVDDSIDYIKDFVIGFDVLCAGGSYDYVINGITKYKRQTIYSYNEDNLTFEQVNYRINNGEAFIEESIPFKLNKQRGVSKVEINGDKYARNKLFVTIFGWLDSSYIDDILDPDVFYRIKLAHKDVVGLNTTLKIELSADEETRSINNLHLKNKNEDSSAGTYGYMEDAFNEWQSNDTGFEVIDDSINVIEAIEPSIECVGIDKVVEFPAWQSSKIITVVTNPIDSKVAVKYTGSFIKDCVIDAHRIQIKLIANPYGIERKCMFTVINEEYPTVTTSFMIKQNG